MSEFRILEGDCLTRLADLPDRSVQTCVTSPPYWGLRDYGSEGQLGLEPTPEQYVENMVAVFREVRRVLRDDGTLWLNLGDSYAGSGPNRHGDGVGASGENNGVGLDTRNAPPGLKPKDLVGIPWMVAFALRADGWYLRSDIIWAKPNPMPESVTDRPTKAHEYLFLLTKGPRYYYDHTAIREESDPEQTAHNERYAKPYDNEARINGGQPGNVNNIGIHSRPGKGGRNKRSVWTVTTQPFSFARVRAHDKTYKASPDCPEHGLLADLERWRRAADGERQGGRRYRIDSSDARRALARLDESVARSGPSSSGSPSSSSERTSQSNGASRTQAPSTAASPDGSVSPTSRTMSSQGRNGSQRRSSDSPALADALPASASSKGSRRSAARSGPGGNASEEPDARTRYTEPSDVRPEPSGSDSHGTLQTSSHTSRTCTCEESVLDHFATFPPKLIEPCILAGSPPKCCGECGAPWERVRERTGRMIQQQNGPDTVKAHIQANGAHGATSSLTTGYSPEYETTGWRSTCDHDDDSGTATVLDPFNGAGTTGLVALRHDRDYIGIELNPEYAQMARDRILDDAPLLNMEAA